MANKQNGYFDFDFTKFMGDLKVPAFDFDALFAAQKANVEALTQANKLAFEGFQAVATRQAEIVRQAIEQASKTLSDISKTSSADERVALQADLAKATFDQTLANAKELTEMTQKSNAEAFDVIYGRFTAGLDEVKAAAQKH